MARDPVPTRRPDVASVLTAMLLGALAFLVGYGILLLSNAGRSVDLPASIPFDVAVPGGWQIVGWLFYSAHQAAIDATTMGYAVTLPLQQLSTWEPWYAFVPIGSLAVAGFLLVRLAGPTDPVSGFVTGASVALGYLPLAVGGYALLAHTTASPIGPVTVQPDLLASVLLVGVTYPALFGGIGGAAATGVGE